MSEVCKRWDAPSRIGNESIVGFVHGAPVRRGHAAHRAEGGRRGCGNRGRGTQPNGRSGDFGNGRPGVSLPGAAGSARVAVGGSGGGTGPAFQVDVLGPSSPLRSHVLRSVAPRVSALPCRHVAASRCHHCNPPRNTTMRSDRLRVYSCSRCIMACHSSRARAPRAVGRSSATKPIRRVGYFPYAVCQASVGIRPSSCAFGRNSSRMKRR